MAQLTFKGGEKRAQGGRKRYLSAESNAADASNKRDTIEAFNWFLNYIDVKLNARIIYWVMSRDA